MTVSIIGTNGLLATELGQFCNQNKIFVQAFGRNEPNAYNFQEFIKLDLSSELINVEKILNSDIVFYTTGAGIQSNLKDSSSSIYKLNTFIPITLSQELNDKGFKGTLVSFGSCFEIGNNNESRLFSEEQVATSLHAVPNAYCVSKRLLTRYIVSENSNSFKHLHLILPTIYGEKEAAHRLIPYAVSSIKNKQPMQFTRGVQVRQYLYSGDLPAIVFDLVSLKKNGVFNIPGIETFSVRRIVEMIYEFYGLKTTEELFGKAERGDVGMLDLQLDGNKISRVLSNAKYTKFIDSLKFYDICL